jgi:hypothetical protein
MRQWTESRFPEYAGWEQFEFFHDISRPLLASDRHDHRPTNPGGLLTVLPFVAWDME